MLHHLQAMKMTFLKLFFICMFKDPKLAEKWTNLAKNPKKNLTPRSSWSLFFPSVPHPPCPPPPTCFLSEHYGLLANPVPPVRTAPRLAVLQHVQQVLLEGVGARGELVPLLPDDIHAASLLLLLPSSLSRPWVGAGGLWNMAGVLQGHTGVTGP